MLGGYTIMTKKEKEIEEIKREIERLQEKLKKLEALPEFDEDERLLDIKDFPFFGLHINLLMYRGKIFTVNDLLHSSPEEILNINGIGKSYLNKITEWMNKHGLMFVG